MNNNVSHTYAICAYKESPYLEECIKSLKKQTVESKLIMATSTPCKHILDLADKYDIELFVNDNPPGIATDWNFAYSKANTPYVTIAHQDDVYLKNYTEEILKHMAYAKNPLIAFSNYGELRGKDRVFKSKLLMVKKLLLLPLNFRFLWKSKLARRMCLSLGSCICCPSVTFARENLPEVLFTTEFKSNLDWQAWYRLSKLDGEFVYCKKALMLHRIHEESETTRIINDNNRSTEDLEMFKCFWPTPIAKLINKLYSSGEKSNSL